MSHTDGNSDSSNSNDTPIPDGDFFGGDGQPQTAKVEPNGSASEDADGSLREEHQSGIGDDLEHTTGSGTTTDDPRVRPLLGEDKPPPMEWRVEDLIREGYPSILYGTGGTVKSTIGLYLSLRIVTGRPFFGRETKQGRVLYLDYELNREDQLRRVHRLCPPIGVDPTDSSLQDQLLYWKPRPLVGSDELQREVMEKIEAHGVDFVLLDSLTLSGKGDQKDESDVVPVMQKIKRWPATTLLIDHVSHGTAKGNTARPSPYGSIFKKHIARNAYHVTEVEDAEDQYRLETEKSNFSAGGEILSYAVEWRDEVIEVEGSFDNKETDATTSKKASPKPGSPARQRVWDAFEQAAENHEEDEIPLTKIVDASPVGKSTTRDHLTNLIKKDGMPIERTEQGRIRKI